ncbi:LPS export ABC transporter periplasmic protein LptC [Ferrimonas marina]|uniref:Lipopolysaccharide export system protein LptC n=1 Tax=Ferrimonas marina TaxID=299255 RepID=A0A1M5Y2D5_9GAMM|nr:LPS export ABC transporter periplasmic protein LptC [Ferrimonas marina]SHI05968.1 lipopolysaccharide export system protein LptC [Ferrimonas marina]
MKRELLAGLLMLAMAGGLYWRSVQLEDNAPAYDSASDPDFVARALKIRSFDERGRLTGEIAADSMQHFEEQQLTEFERPVTLIHPENGDGAWKVEASAGVLTENRYLELTEQVLVTAIEPDEPLSRLSTTALSVDLQTMVMTSDAIIEAEGNTFTLSAEGLWADLNSNQMKLQRKVNATYEVQ